MPSTKNIGTRLSAFRTPTMRCAAAARGRVGEASCWASALAQELGIWLLRRLSIGFATPSTTEQPLNRRYGVAESAAGPGWSKALVDAHAVPAFSSQLRAV